MIRPRVWLGRLGIVVAATVSAAGMVEGILTALDLPSTASEFEFLGPELGLRDVFEADATLFWRLRANAPGLAVNELGLRGWLPSGAKLPDDVRIVCIGDSSTFGVNQREADTWPRRLERTVQDAFPWRRVETIVAALPGWSSYQNRKLVEQHLPRFAPDLTVFYIGAWNDYVPAIGAPDHVRGSRSGIARTRVASILDRIGSRDRASYVADFEHGVARDGRRVPLGEFRANLEAILSHVETAGSDVLVVLPPVSDEMLRRFPIGTGYQDELRRFASSHQLRLLDGRRLFHDRAAGGDPCYADGVHPNAHGHAVLAAALAPFAQATAARSGARQTPVAALELTALSGLAMDSMTGGLIELTGSDASAVERARLGEIPIGVRRSSGSTVVLEVPALLPPGSHELIILGAFGRSVVGTVEATGPTLRARCAKEASPRILAIDGRGPPGWGAIVWISPILLPAPRATAFGAFHLPQKLPVEADDRAAWSPDQVALPRLDVRIDASGTFAIRRELSTSEAANVPPRWFAQALLVDPEHPTAGLLTEPTAGERTR